MPSNEKASVMRRQWELLMMLPTSGTGMTAAELTKSLNNAGYNISKRQVERDLNELLEAVRLDHDVDTMPRGWRWPNGLSMTLSEALSLQLVEDTIKSLMPISMLGGLESRFRKAREVLAKLGKENRKAKWASKVRFVSPTMPLVPPKIDHSVLSAVQEALLADEQIEVEYRSMGAEETKTIMLSPLALVNRGAVSYLIATADEYEEVRLFAMHRMRKAIGSVQSVKRPADFDVDEYIQAGGLHFGSGKTIRLSAWVEPILEKMLKETPLSADQKLSMVDDRVKLTATVADSWQLTWWLMSQGPDIEVVAPVALRRKIGGLLSEAAAQYAK